MWQVNIFIFQMVDDASVDFWFLLLNESHFIPVGAASGGLTGLWESCRIFSWEINLVKVKSVLLESVRDR